MANYSMEEGYKTMVIIWLAMLFAQLMMPVVVYLVRPEVYRFDLTKPVLGDNPPIVIVFAAVAVINLVLSFVMKKRAFDQAVEKQQIALVQTGQILAYAFCEAISLLGIVLAFVFSYQYFLVWFALGIIGILLHFPRREAVIAASYKK